MLAYILALTVGLGSLGIYLAAFFFPEIHRKNDFIWSGVGLFYALVLWVCAGRITGSLVLGQVAGVALLGWSITQMWSLRRQLTPRQLQTELPSADEIKKTVQEKVSMSLPQRLSQLQQRVTGVTGVKDRAIEQNRVQVIDKRTPVPQQPASPNSPKDVQAGQDSPIVRKELISEIDELIEKALTEEEAIALAVETTLAEATKAEASVEEQASSIIHPNSPDPESVEAAILDAQEKSEDFSPPDPKKKDEQR